MLGKKVWGIVIALALLIVPFSVSHASTASIEPGFYAVTTTALHFRTGPGTDYRVLQVLPADTSVFVQEGPVNGNWYKVSYNNQLGYVYGTYLLQGPNEPHIYTTTTAALNLRTGPGTNYAVQLVMPAGATVFVNAGPTNGNWYTVTYNNVVGYAYGDYLALPR